MRDDQSKRSGLCSSQFWRVFYSIKWGYTVWKPEVIFLLNELYSLLMKNHCVMSWKSSLNLPDQGFEQNKMSPHRIHLSCLQEPPDVFVTEYA